MCAWPQTGDHVAFRYEVLGVLGRGSFGQARPLRSRCLCQSACAAVTAEGAGAASRRCCDAWTTRPGKLWRSRSSGASHCGDVLAGTGCAGRAMGAVPPPPDAQKQEALPEAGSHRGFHTGSAQGQGEEGSGVGRDPAHEPRPTLSAPMQDPDDAANIVRAHDSFAFR